jgi:hypothetical protein
MEIGKWTLGEKKKEILNPNIQRTSRFLQIAKTAEVVIPGKRSPAPHGVQGEAQPGIQDYQRNLDSGFRRNDAVGDFCKSLSRI